MNPGILLNTVIDIFFPSFCVYCGIQVKREEFSLCGNCLNSIEYLSDTCGKCSSTLIRGSCTMCQDREVYVEKHIIIAEYSDVMKEILHNYKFKKNRRLSGILSNLAVNKINEFSKNIDILTFVPINRKKKMDRGFNQSELIADNTAKKINKKCRSLLKEKYHFKTQKKLGYRERFLNILDRYKAINTKHIKGKRILIIDDVITTGATINECARILKLSGAEKVYSMTIAGVHYA